MSSDKLAAARRAFDEATERARRDPEYLAQLEAEPEQTLLAAGLRFPDAAAAVAELRRRVMLTDEMREVRATLDVIADKARLDAAYRARLEEKPKELLRAAGLSGSQARAVTAEMRSAGAGPSPFRGCEITCCRKPGATSWSCDVSVLV
jgi:hypothetical protein